MAHFVGPRAWATLRLGVTEPRFSSALNDEKREGVYACRGCGAVLYSSKDKWNSGSGWPSFMREGREGALAFQKESDGRLEIRCARCSGHLGRLAPRPRPSLPRRPAAC